MNLMAQEAILSSTFQEPKFSDAPVTDAELDALFHCAEWCPSTQNIQPVSYVVVRDKKTIQDLSYAMFCPRSYLDAPCLIFFCVDRFAPQKNAAALEEILLEGDADRLQRFVKMFFSKGILGFQWLVKAIFTPIFHMFTPMPRFASVHKREWAVGQAMLATGHCIVTAQLAGFTLAYVDLFDESRLKRILHLPHSTILASALSLGHRASPAPSPFPVPTPHLPAQVDRR